MRADTSGLRELKAALGKADGQMFEGARRLLSKTALETKKGTQAAISTHPTWKRLAPAVSYDLYGLAAEVGYEDVGQGELAGIYEFGSARRDPHPTLGPQVLIQQAIFFREAEKLARSIL